MFSSRTLTDRNNEEWIVSDGLTTWRCTDAWKASATKHKTSFTFTRVLPENPILVRLRSRLDYGDSRAKLYPLWLNSMQSELAAHDDEWLSSLCDTERPHVAHAHRVLSLLAAVTR